MIAEKRKLFFSRFYRFHKHILDVHICRICTHTASTHTCVITSLHKTNPRCCQYASSYGLLPQEAPVMIA